MRPLDARLRSLVDDTTQPVTADEARSRAAAGPDSEPSSTTSWRPRRSVALVGGALVVVGVLIGGLVTLTSHDDTPTRVQTPTLPAVAPMPSGIAAVTTDHRLVLLSPSGEVLRTLSEDAIAEGKDADGATSLSVTPDGKSLYFMRPACGGCTPTIAAVAIEGGVTTNPTGEGSCCVREPAVSPDGRWLALTGVPNQSDAGRDILLIDLAKPQPTSLPVDRQWSSNATLSAGISGLTWLDATHLLFVQGDAPDGAVPRVLDIDVPQDTLLDQLPPLPIQGADALGRLAVRGDTGELLAVRAPALDDRDESGTPSADAVVTVDIETGRPRASLFELDGAQHPVSDTSGDHVLTTANGDLYRWSSGDVAPTHIASGITGAVWVPATGPVPVSDEPTPVVVSRGGIIAARTDDLVLLTEAGDVVRTIASLPPGLSGGIAVSPDGSQVYVARTRIGAQCGTGAEGSIVRVPVTGGEPVTVMTGASTPMISDDGKWLAASGYPGCNGGMPPQQLRLLDLTSGVEVTPLGASAASVPFAWQPDGSLLYQASAIGRLSGDAARPSILRPVEGEWQTVGESVLPAPDGQYAVIRATFDGNRLYVISTPATKGPGTRVVELDPVAGAPLGAIADFPNELADSIERRADGSLLIHLVDHGRVELIPPGGWPRVVTRGVQAATWLP
jgi:hypothetical protein